MKITTEVKAAPAIIPLESIERQLRWICRPSQSKGENRAAIYAMLSAFTFLKAIHAVSAVDLADKTVLFISDGSNVITVEIEL